MPLQKGTSPEALTANISELIRAGHGPEQATAIAHQVAAGSDSAAGICYRAGDSVLLVLRAPTASAHPLTWAFPGGSIDPGETPEQAAIRESREEISYTPADPFITIDWQEGFTTFGVSVSAPFTPILNHEHVGYAWAPLTALPQPLHPGVASTFSRLPTPVATMDAAKIVDGNGWFEVKANPISKAGIFPYSGRQLGMTGPDADRIFQVLRPPEELSDPECLASFRLIPWIDEHVMLGPAAQEINPGAVPAENKGVQGVIGEEVFFKDGILFANIKAFSNTLAELIRAGKRELSAGYRCIYEIASGVWQGQKYDAVQRKIRGNHLALVKEGRMGPDVAVLDKLTFTFDAREIEMPDVKKPEAGAGDGEGEKSSSGMTLEQLVSVVTELAPQIAKLTAAMSTLTGAAESKNEAAVDKEVTPPPAGEGVAKVAAMDQAQLEKQLLTRIVKRDILAKQISAHVGAFDHAEKTLEEVVKYGCEKLKIVAEVGQEAAALAGFLQAMPAALPSARVAAMDAITTEAVNFVTKHLGGK